MAYNDGIRVGPIAYIGGVSVIVTAVLVLLLQVLYYQQRDRMQKADLAAAGSPHELAELTSKQQLALTQRGYVDREQGIVAVGIERATELVVQDLSAGKLPGEVIGPRRAPAAATEPASSTSGGEPAVKNAEAGAGVSSVSPKN